MNSGKQDGNPDPFPQDDLRPGEVLLFPWKRPEAHDEPIGTFWIQNPPRPPGEKALYPFRSNVRNFPTPEEAVMHWESAGTPIRRLFFEPDFRTLVETGEIVPFPR